MFENVLNLVRCGPRFATHVGEQIANFWLNFDFGAVQTWATIVDLKYSRMNIDNKNIGFVPTEKEPSKVRLIHFLILQIFKYSQKYQGPYAVA